MAANPKNWPRIKALFDAALELKPEERSHFLREISDEPEVCAEVRRLLTERERAGSFPSSPVLDEAVKEPAADTERINQGQILAGRFKITRFIAAGGMGEVYEAEDLEMREHVAIKTIRRDILQQPNAMLRFRREVQLARKVTHPNVCRVFDLFRHSPPGPELGAEVIFVTMELLRGRTLARRLRDVGCLTTAEAFTLVEQMASALSAAHDVGVIHGDFKPGNVLLVPSQKERHRVRAVVTDFGLASKSPILDSDPPSTAESVRTHLAGTLIYMAPEQIEGKPATAASDIYALGLVIYEMVTGQHPFHSDTPLSIALKRLLEPPIPPSHFVRELSETWETTILRCLQREPTSRFARAQDILAPLIEDFSKLNKGSANVQQQPLRLTKLNAPLSTAWANLSTPHQSSSQKAVLGSSTKAIAGEPRVSLSALPASGEHFSGREAELARLDTAWSDPATYVVSIVAWGGVGKSALVNRWLGRMAQNSYGGAERVFGWSFYRQGTNDRLACADQFIDTALRWFGDAEPSNGSPRDRGVRLAELVRRQRTLLVLDGLEPLQCPPGPNAGRIKDDALQVLLRELAAQNSGLCVVTTREPIIDIAARQGTTTVRIDLSHLAPATGARVLHELGVHGTEAELQSLSEEYHGHALALTLLGTYLRDLYGGDIRRSGEVQVVPADIEEGGQARRVMFSYEIWFRQNGRFSELAVVLLLGFFDRPASPAELECLREAKDLGWLGEVLRRLADNEFRQVTARLRQAGLLLPAEVPGDDALDAHPLVREYCGRRLRDDHPEVWRAGHNCLYEYLKLSSKKTPETLEGMLPLYAAVAHGCAAGRYEDALFKVYWKRIQRRNELYSLKVLGAVGTDTAALANFFEQPWDQPVHEISAKGQSFLLEQAGENLHVLGRVSEAVKPMKLFLHRGLESKRWADAVKGAITLSEFALTMGKIQDAVSYGRDSVKYADIKAGLFHRQVSRATLADALHQSGNFSDAEEWFAEAEKIECIRQPTRPQLSSMQGYAYCELLLSLGRFDEAEHRSAQALQLAEADRSLLPIALSRLALGRACLLRACRDGSTDYSLPAFEFDMAIEGLHRAGAEFQLPRGLLARAEVRRLQGRLADARRDLREARETAARGQMKLQEADCLLEIVRISIAAGDTHSAASTLETAQRMIDGMGYHRRRGALQELLAMIGPG